MTERKPAREVVLDSIQRMFNVAGEEEADVILSDITEAGYPVEAGPAMREALSEAIDLFEQTSSGPATYAVLDKMRAALAKEQS